VLPPPPSSKECSLRDFVEEKEDDNDGFETGDDGREVRRSLRAFADGYGTVDNESSSSSEDDESGIYDNDALYRLSRKVELARELTEELSSAGEERSLLAKEMTDGGESTMTTGLSREYSLRDFVNDYNTIDEHVPPNDDAHEPTEERSNAREERSLLTEETIDGGETTATNTTTGLSKEYSLRDFVNDYNTIDDDEYSSSSSSAYRTQEQKRRRSTMGATTTTTDGEVSALLQKTEHTPNGDDDLSEGDEAGYVADGFVETAMGSRTKTDSI